MFVYGQRAGTAETRPGWVITTRLVTMGVTIAMAWPHLTAHGWLYSGILLYAVISALTVFSIMMERRWQLSLFASTFHSLQLGSELIVISSIVCLSGGVSSPSVTLYLMTIMSAALSYRLIGTLVVAGLASASYVTAVWIGAGHQAAALWSSGWMGALGQLTDEEFFAAFLRLCIFFVCAFAGGYLAERLYSKDEALAHTSEALKLAKWETGDILKHLHSGILTVDITGSVVYFNRAAEEILGVDERQVRGRTLAEGFGRQFPALAERLEAVLRSRKMDIRTELRLERPDGRSLPVGLSTSVLGGAGGVPRGVIAVFQDLTEAKQFEDRIRSQDRLAAIGELSAGIAHEIRNPLAAIYGSVEVLCRELNLTGENQRLMQLILCEAARLNKILSDFLLYARMQPGSAPARVDQVLAEVLELGRQHLAEAGETQPRLESVQTARGIMVDADPDHLKQILINLLFNGIEACLMYESGGPHQVRISVTRPTPGQMAGLTDEPDPADWIAVSVSDTGPGIPDSVQDRLYEPFVSSKPHGTGLGLAIVRRLVENARGQIAAESRPGEGTVFTVYLRLFHAEPVSGAPATLTGTPAR